MRSKGYSTLSVCVSICFSVSVYFLEVVNLLRYQQLWRNVAQKDFTVNTSIKGYGIIYLSVTSYSDIAATFSTNVWQQASFSLPTNLPYTSKVHALFKELPRANYILLQSD